MLIFSSENEIIKASGHSVDLKIGYRTKIKLFLVKGDVFELIIIMCLPISVLSNVLLLCLWLDALLCETIVIAVVANVVVDLIGVIIAAMVLFRLILVASIHENRGSVLDVHVTSVVAQNLLSSLSACVHITVLDIVIRCTMLLDTFPLLGKGMTTATRWGDESDHPGIVLIVQHSVLIGISVEHVKVLPVLINGLNGCLIVSLIGRFVGLIIVTVTVQQESLKGVVLVIV